MKSTKWSTGVFPPLTLTAQQEAEFRHLVRGLVRETLTHANSFQRLPESERNLAKQKHWKTVKTRDNLTVFKERDPPKIITGTSFDTPEHQRLTADDWQTPKLLVGVGSIAGSLDDVMYGVVTPDAQAMLLNAAMVRNSLTDGAVLAQIDGPTLDAPYRFLGIKWVVKGPPATLRSFVQPQDLVLVEATGILKRSNGDRIGYQLLHSVDLDGYGALPGRGLTRGRLSSCTIFRETQDGRRVDVYVRGYVEEHGKLLNSVSLKAASTGFLSSWNAVKCSHVKKLRWFLENPHFVTWKQDAATRSQSSNAQTPVRSHASTSFDGSISFLLRSSSSTRPNDRCGGTCDRKVKKAWLCSLCQNSVCSKCRVTKKLISATCDLKLERQESVICRSCLAKVRLEPVLSIAQQEIREGRYCSRLSNQFRQARSAKRQAPKPALPSPSCGYARSNPASGPHFFFREPNASKHSNVEFSGTAVSLLDRQRLHQLEQQQSQAANTRLIRPKPRWFRRYKKREQICDESRPVLFGESTMLSECQSGTLSQCSTMVDSISTTSPINPLAYSWVSSVQENESDVCVDENDKDGWPNILEFTESQQERQELWHQISVLRLAVESTYQIAKRTTVSCCGPSFSPLEKTSGPI